MSLFDQKEVMKMYNVFNRWFGYFKERKVAIPTSFNANILLNIMIVLFNTQDALAITQSLYFWYEYCSLFSPDVNAYFFNFLVKFFFFKLILHWSRNVREAFLFFLCHRVVLTLELRKCTPIYEQLIVTVNLYLNVISQISQAYQQRLFTFNRLDKAQKRHQSVRAIKEDILQTVEKTDKAKLHHNFFRDIPAFKELFVQYLKDFVVLHDYFKPDKTLTPHVEEDGSVNVSIDNINTQELQTMTEMKFLRLNPHSMERFPVSTVRISEMQYCPIAIADFQTHLRNYFTLKNESSTFNESILPKLTMKLPIDEFESMSEEDKAW